MLDTVPVNAPVEASNTTEPLSLTSPVTSPVTLPVTSLTMPLLNVLTPAIVSAPVVCIITVLFAISVPIIWSIRPVVASSLSSLFQVSP